MGNDHHRQCVTRKIKDPKWQGPAGATLAVDILDPGGGELAVMFQMNSWNAYPGMSRGHYYACKSLNRSDGWQTVVVSLEDLRPVDDRSAQHLAGWQFMTELGLVAMGRAQQNDQSAVLAGASWSKDRQYKNLRWIEGTTPEP